MSIENKQQNEPIEEAIPQPVTGVPTDTFLGAAFEFFRFIGLFGIQSYRVMSKGLKAFYEKRLHKHCKKLDTVGLNIFKRISQAYKFVTFKIYMFFKFFVDAKNVIKKGFNSHPETSVFIRLIYTLSAFFKGVRNNTKIFVTAVNYALPVVALALFFNLISYVSTINFAVAVEYNGENIGYIENEAVFEQAENKLQERMTYIDGEEAISSSPKFTVAIVDDTKLKTDAELTDTIIRSSAGEIVKATGLKIDGEFYGAVKDGEQLQSTLDKMRDAYKTNAPGEIVSFAKDVKTETGIFKAANIVDEAELEAKITALTEMDVFYEVVSGDTPIMIASKNDMELDDIVALNPDILTDCKIGKQVQVKKAQAFLPVQVTRPETYERSLDYATTYTESAKIYEGTKRTVTKGVEGREAVTANVHYVDGVEVGRDIISQAVVAAPVSAVIEKGTMKLPAKSVNRGNTSDYGFQWPVAGGYISQHYGNYGHNGLDYAYRGNGYGQPIWAAIPGTVTFAGKSGSYGNLVILTSPGGIQTWYAHCSALLVSSGETVGKGQQIGRIGSTGRSTGNHLHFRVLINGVQKNPMNYLP